MATSPTCCSLTPPLCAAPLSCSHPASSSRGCPGRLAWDERIICLRRCVQINFDNCTLKAALGVEVQGVQGMGDDKAEGFADDDDGGDDVPCCWQLQDVVGLMSASCQSPPWSGDAPCCWPPPSTSP